jgi:hypothetical protein
MVMEHMDMGSMGTVLDRCGMETLSRKRVRRDVSASSNSSFMLEVGEGEGEREACLKAEDTAGGDR